VEPATPGGIVMRARRPLLPVLALVFAAGLAGCGQTTTTGSGAATSTVARSTPAPAGSAPAPPLVLAGAFARAYAVYLDGRLPARSLPGTTPAAQAQAGPVIPADLRAGSITVASVQQPPGQPVFTVQLRDRQHTFPAQATVTQVNGQWQVTAVVAPDLDSILHGHTPPAPPPVGSADPAQAARAFLQGYLPWTYAQVPLSAVSDLTRALRAQLAASPPNVPPRFRALHPHVIVLGLKRAGGAWDAYATVADGQVTYTVTVVISLIRGRWLASQLVQPH